MLVALCQGQRVEAMVAQRVVQHQCPGCNSDVILKRGRKTCAHFAHKPSTSCSGNHGETRAHLQLKSLITKTLRDRGLRAEPEFAIGSTPWERRADIMTWAPRSNTPIAIELQRSSLSIKELELRAQSYCRMGVAQFWITFLPSPAVDQAEQDDEITLRIPRYAPRQHELWIHGQNNHEGCWMADPDTGQFWHAYFEAHELTTKEAIWYDMGAVKRYRKPVKRTSRRYRELVLKGPFYIEDLKIKLTVKQPAQSKYFKWPGGTIASFIKT